MNKMARSHLAAAAGVVNNQQTFFDYPVCAFKEREHFIDSAATPPLEEGSAEACPK